MFIYWQTGAGGFKRPAAYLWPGQPFQSTRYTTVPAGGGGGDVTKSFSSPISVAPRFEHADPLSSPISVGTSFGSEQINEGFSSPITVGTRLLGRTGVLFAPRYRK